MKTLLELLVCCPHLLLNDQKAAGQLLRQMVCDQLIQNRIDLDTILVPVQVGYQLTWNNPKLFGFDGKHVCFIHFFVKFIFPIPR